MDFLLVYRQGSRTWLLTANAQLVESSLGGDELLELVLGQIDNVLHLAQDGPALLRGRIGALYVFCDHLSQHLFFVRCLLTELLQPNSDIFQRNTRGPLAMCFCWGVEEITREHDVHRTQPWTS